MSDRGLIAHALFDHIHRSVGDVLILIFFSPLDQYGMDKKRWKMHT